jgi:hypothetical protein
MELFMVRRLQQRLQGTTGNNSEMGMTSVQTE